LPAKMATEARVASVSEGSAWRAQNLFTHNVPGDQKRARTPVHCQCPRRSLENLFLLNCTGQKHKKQELGIRVLGGEPGEGSNQVTRLSGISIHTAFQKSVSGKLYKPHQISKTESQTKQFPEDRSLKRGKLRRRRR